MAKLHSCFSANSRRCASFITPSTVSRVISGDMAFLVTGRMRPLTFIDGGTPAVMNRSEPPFSTIRRSSFTNSMDSLDVPARPSAAPETVSDAFRCLGLLAGGLAADQPLGHQRLLTGVEGLHAQRAAGLDRRVHLRHLVLADQVTDRRGADHDLVGGHPAAADLLQQGL